MNPNRFNVYPNFLNMCYYIFVCISISDIRLFMNVKDNYIFEISLLVDKVGKQILIRIGL